MTRLLIATTNQGKLRELRQLFSPIEGVTLVGPTEVGPLPEVDEDGDTFEANAEKKARIYSAASGLPVLADDSGLVVDALGGRPGVHSARFAGDHGDDQANIDKLLRELAGVAADQRTARFKAVLVLVGLTEEPLVTEGACEGHILEARRGAGGFGYDPVFLVRDAPAPARTMAELGPEEKNAISHRGVASRKMATRLAQILATNRP